MKSMKHNFKSKKANKHYNNSISEIIPAQPEKYGAIVKTKKSIYKMPWASVLMILVAFCMFFALAGCADFTEETTNASDCQVKSIEFSDTSDIEFDYSDYPDTEFFSAEISDKNADYNELLDFISENPKIATIEYDESSMFLQSVTVTPVSNGETYIYIQTKDGKVKSQKIKVVVDIESEEATTNETITKETTKKETTTKETTKKETTTKKKSSRTVYTTPYGKKYHYSKSCAGKNAMESELDDVKGIYDPCKKCVG